MTKKEADLDGREFVSGVKQPGLHLPLQLTGCEMEPPLHQECLRSAPGSLFSQKQNQAQTSFLLAAISENITALFKKEDQQQQELIM